MNPVFDREFEGLIEKYAELLTGQSSPDIVEKVKKWALYNQIHKSMPALASHWNQTHPEAKREVRLLFEEIRRLNDALRAQRAEAGPTSGAIDKE